MTAKPTALGNQGGQRLSPSIHHVPGALIDKWVRVQVFKALRNGVQIVAVKVFKEEATRGAITSLNSPYHAAQFRQEISILKSCHDKNIVQFIGACLTVSPHKPAVTCQVFYSLPGLLHCLPSGSRMFLRMVKGV